uniref:Peptidase A1 domain-containing protein n=1 Tax=Fagus sylvatica TaxID=28930 RepID=A0A2N9EX00_FAGSY
MTYSSTSLEIGAVGATVLILFHILMALRFAVGATVLGLLFLHSIFFNQTLATEQNPNSLVLSMTYSSTSPPFPKSRASIQSEMEQVRKVRGGHLISLDLGSPPQVNQAIMDNRRDLTSIYCDDCSFGKLTATFSPSFSSSSTRDLCNSSLCNEIHRSDHFCVDPCTQAGCSSATKSTCFKPCPSFSYPDGVGGLLNGTLTRDTLMVHGNGPGTTREIPNFCFACVCRETNIGNIAGFGRGPLSIPSQLQRNGFSHCFLGFEFANNPNISSPLVIGDAAIFSKDYLQITPFLKSLRYPNHYYIGLEAITIGNSSAIKVPLNFSEFDSHGNGGFLVDSTTTYSRFPEPLYLQILSKLWPAITYHKAKEIEMRTGFDLCYKVPCTNNNTCTDDLHSITFHFRNNASLVLPQGNLFYAVEAPSESMVVKCLLFEKMNDDNDFGAAGVLGSYQLQNVEVVYNLEQETIGLQPTNCALEAAAQGLHKT